MPALAELSDIDRDEALQLAHYVVEALRDGLVFPLSVTDPGAQDEILRMSQYLIELAEPDENRALTVDGKFDKDSST